MRLRALPLLLGLTIADYVLWDWSIADGHDIVSLVSGLTLLPMAGVTMAMLVVGGGRLVRHVLGTQAGGTFEAEESVDVDSGGEDRRGVASEESSSGRLAA